MENRHPDIPEQSLLEKAESSWEEFEKTGSVHAALSYLQNSRNSEEPVPKLPS